MIRVLVADDQALIRTGFATIIDAQPDMEIVGECGDGRAAVDLAVRLRPDVVVMDVRMPVLDGIEATRLLAGAGATDPVKVLVVTTFNLDEYVYEALRAGASGFLLKDAPPAQLLQGIRTVAGGAALLAPEVTRQLVGRYAARIRPSGGTPEDIPLTPRELEVLRLIADGRSNSEIAATLVISHETVKTYVSRILTKLDLRDRVQAVVYAYRRGLVTSRRRRLRASPLAAPQGQHQTDDGDQRGGRLGDRRGDLAGRLPAVLVEVRQRAQLTHIDVRVQRHRDRRTARHQQGQQPGKHPRPDQQEHRNHDRDHRLDPEQRALGHHRGLEAVIVGGEAQMHEGIDAEQRGSDHRKQPLAGGDPGARGGGRDGGWAGNVIGHRSGLLRGVTLSSS
jgi:DNA-binding NarL/FixJ family response regulator